jgi:hypothetical protein
VWPTAAPRGPIGTTWLLDKVKNCYPLLPV